MENQEAISGALDEFNKEPIEDISSLLDSYLAHVAKTGELQFPWSKVCPVFSQKLDNVMKKFNEDCPTDNLPSSKNAALVHFNDTRERILTQVKSFTGAPFTIQRLCELVTDPKKHYKRTDKFLRSIEKNVLVVSTVDSHGRKVVNEKEPKSPLMNGLDVNGVESSTSNSINSGFSFTTSGTSHSWGTGHVATAWPSDEPASETLAHSEHDDLCQSSAKRPRLCTEDSSTDSSEPTQSCDAAQPIDNTSTECLASISSSDSSTSNSSEETDGPTSTTSSSSSLSSVPFNTFALSSSSETLLEQKLHPTELPMENISSSEDKLPESSDNANTDNLKTSSTDCAKVGQSHITDVSVFETGDSTGFDTGNLKPTESVGESGDVTKPHDTISNTDCAQGIPESNQTNNDSLQEKISSSGISDDKQSVSLGETSSSSDQNEADTPDSQGRQDEAMDAE